jgi:hypothetical protein
MEDETIKSDYERTAALFPPGAEVVIEHRRRFGQLVPGHSPTGHEIAWVFVHVDGQCFTARNPDHEELIGLVELVRCRKASLAKAAAASPLYRGGYPEAQPAECVR